MWANVALNKSRTEIFYNHEFVSNVKFICTFHIRYVLAQASQPALEYMPLMTQDRIFLAESRQAMADVRPLIPEDRSVMPKDGPLFDATTDFVVMQQFTPKIPTVRKETLNDHLH